MIHEYRPRSGLQHQRKRLEGNVYEKYIDYVHKVKKVWGNHQRGRYCHQYGINCVIHTIPYIRLVGAVYQ